MAVEAVTLLSDTKELSTAAVGFAGILSSASNCVQNPKSDF
jgi:hypothetical protein